MVLVQIFWHLISRVNTEPTTILRHLLLSYVNEFKVFSTYTIYININEYYKVPKETKEYNKRKVRKVF